MGFRFRFWCAHRSECAALTSPRSFVLWWLRVVRDPDLDRRPGDFSMLASCGRSRRHGGRRLDLLLRVLGAEHVRDLRGIETIKFLEGIGAPFMLGSGCCCCGGSRTRLAASVPVLSSPSKFHTTAEFVHFFIPSLTGMVGFWATVALNIPDFTRYAESQKAQAVGQAIGSAHGDDAVFVHRGRGDFRVRGPVRRSDLGPGGCCSASSISRWWR